MTTDLNRVAITTALIKMSMLDREYWTEKQLTGDEWKEKFEEIRDELVNFIDPQFMLDRQLEAEEVL